MTGFSLRPTETLEMPSAGDDDFRSEQSKRGAVRSLIVVARDQPELFKALARQFAGDPKVVVFLDRRRLERRQRVQKDESGRRVTDRRRPPSIERDVHRRSFVIIRHQDEADCETGP